MRRGGKNTQKNCIKKDLHDPDNHDGVITHLEPDILECEVKWDLGSITINKTKGGDGIPVELFITLKDDALKVHQYVIILNMSANLQDQAVATELEEVNSLIPLPKKGSTKECSNHQAIALIFISY